MIRRHPNSPLFPYTTLSRPGPPLDPRWGPGDVVQSNLPRRPRILGVDDDDIDVAGFGLPQDFPKPLEQLARLAQSSRHDASPRIGAPARAAEPQGREHR